ncbi:MAG TPA: hypothetical protein DEO32_02815 [Ruminococcaceae bacterium]|nr:hypothetical protein [Oscillospiraceae bacterium]
MTQYAKGKGGRHYAAEYRDNENKKLSYVPGLLFVGFIFVMAIWFIFNPKLDYSSSEKRYLQKFPETSFETVSSGKFGKDFETFFADHFPARNMWVGVNAYTALLEGNNGAKDIYNCKNGYLINKPIPDDSGIKKNIGAIVDFKNLDAVKNIPMSVVLAPSTGYVCNDVLPFIHNEYKDDQYLADASNTLAQNGISFVDLRETFKNAYRQGNQLYYKTDHHWTSRGAYTAYTELCKSLGTVPASESLFTIEQYSGFYGTTYSSSGFWLTEPDQIEVWNNKSNSAANLHVKIVEATETKESDSVFFYDHLKEDDKYPVFIDGNHAYTEITNSKAEKGTLLVIKDSFSHSMAPFLAETYKKVILVDMRYFKAENVSAVVQREKPEQLLVLYGIDNLANDTDLVWLQ